MTRQTYDILREPRGDTLLRMLRALGRYSSTASLVLRSDDDLDETGKRFMESLRPQLVSQRKGSEWPGTKLIDAEAELFVYALTDAFLDEVARAAPGLYEWLTPDLPEDLALLRDDRTPVLGSIAHERDAFCVLTGSEYATLIADVPELEIASRARE